MLDPIPTSLALLSVAAFALGLGLMTVGRLGVAGAAFLSASVLIYLRERWCQRAADS